MLELWARKRGSCDLCGATDKPVTFYPIHKGSVNIQIRLCSDCLRRGLEQQSKEQKEGDRPD